MSLAPSPPKIVLLAAQLAAKADVDSLAFLASNHGSILNRELLLRILLTYLPGNLRTQDYVSFIQEIEAGEYTQIHPVEIDASLVEGLSDEVASKRVRKLHLQQLKWPGAPESVAEDPLALFLIQRAYAVDDNAGLLSELPELILPFLDHSPYMRTWMVSTLLPLFRRNYEYYPENPIPQSLFDFEKLNDRAAVLHLLSQTGVQDNGAANVGRDLRGLIGPWIYSDTRWTSRKKPLPQENGDVSPTPSIERSLCPGWEQVLQWLTAQAARSWTVAVQAIEQWDGPGDVDLGGYGAMWLDDSEQQYLEQRYARAALASAYLIPEASLEAIGGAYRIATKISGLLDQDTSADIQTAASLLAPVDDLSSTGLVDPQNATYIRNDLLDEANVLTQPARSAVSLLLAITLSAHLLTRAGSACTIRRAGELALLQDEREQKEEALKLIRAISNNGPKGEDKFWVKARNEILWLRDWGAEEVGTQPGESGIYAGVFGCVDKEFLETEILKALLANTRYDLARNLYEDSPDAPLPKKVLQDTVYAAALSAYDNASNPNRTRGGLLKCNEIIRAFPKTLDKSLPETRRIEALLKATHSFSDYRLVLKHNEPITPVVLRVHSDPLSLIAKVLEQNPNSYTRIQHFLDIGINMVAAGLTVRDKKGHPALDPKDEPAHRIAAERRITAMCVEAALAEDDFETAYSYVTGRLGNLEPPSQHPPPGTPADDWSWRAALQAGKYRRTEHTLRPTHLGTTSGNPEIRHLEQRTECLSAALRIAPPSTLQEILTSFRRCEEELDAAVAAENAQESAWDDAADSLRDRKPSPGAMPGAFRAEPGPHGVLTAREAAASGSSAGRARQAEEAPLSLFDLSRAAARAAQRNVAALSSLQQQQQRAGHVSASPAAEAAAEQARVRKRDQLANAAMGTLTSGVGWLIGAQPVREAERD